MKRIFDVRKLLPMILASMATWNCDAAGKAPPEFHWEEATIETIQQAILDGTTTCTQVVQGYFDRIAAYGGVCVGYGKPDVITPSGKQIQLGVLKPIPNAGQVNAFANLNVRGKRSETDLADRDPSKPDALEVAAQLDAQFAKTGKLVGPLHCVAAAIKDQFDTFDLRTTDGTYADFANDRPPQDATVVKDLRDAGAIIIGKANMGEYARARYSTAQDCWMCWSATTHVIP